MIEFGIPEDSVQLRRKVFTQLITPDKSTGYIDGATDYCLLIPYADTHNCDIDMKLWMAYLYGVSYSCTTVFRFLAQFSRLSEVRPKDLKKFWEKHKESLWFQTDKRYLKNNNQVIPAIKSLYQLSHGDLQKYLLPLLEQGFDVTYKEILKNWRFFGPSGAYLFFDALYGLCPELYSEPTHLDWKNCGKTVPEGMAHLLGLDEQALHMEVYDLDRYNKNVDMLASRFKQPKIHIESILCMFRKLFKGTRYHGYYADRQMVECLNTSDFVKEYCEIDLWEYRKLCLPLHFCGELNDWQGIRPQKYKDFLKFGGNL